MKSMLSAAALLLLVGGCARQAGAPAQAQAPAAASAPSVAPGQDLKAEHARWVSDREASLRKPDGWASLTGLHWIEGSEQRVGSGEGNDIKLPIGPESLGTVRQHAGVVSFLPAEHADLTIDGRPVPDAVELKPAGEGGPGTTLSYDAGKGKINLIQRGNALALRVHHADAPTRQHFAGLDFWPAQPEWVVDARFVAHPPGKSIAIVNVIGDSNEVPNPGYLQFEKDGKTWRLEAFGDPSKGLNLMFKDATSGKESYGVGRYLQTGPVGSDGHVAVDFNRAYNPPCAYTDFATCPIPPRENNLAHQQIEGRDASLAVAAGEKSYKGHES